MFFDLKAGEFMQNVVDFNHNFMIIGIVDLLAIWSRYSRLLRLGEPVDENGEGVDHSLVYHFFT